MNTRRLLVSFLAAFFLIAAAAAQILPAHSHAYGKSLNDWLSSYWQWYYAGAPKDTTFQPGPAPVVFMPIPNGTIEVEIEPGTSFVLPLFAWVVERYGGYPGVPDDPTFPFEAIQPCVYDPSDPTRPPQVMLDGRPILENFWDYYCGPTMFPDPVVYDEPTSYGSIAALGFQGVGFVCGPLTPGMHTLTLFENLNLGFLGAPDINIVFENTWSIHVVPPGKG